jgi:hypothetical protein
MKKLLVKPALIALLILIPSAFVVHFVTPAKAATQILGITGFAWSDMPNTSNEVFPTAKQGPVGRGAGWINLNGASGGTVTIDSAGALHGYAWTPNMGWIKFDPAGPYPGSVPSGNTLPTSPISPSNPPATPATASPANGNPNTMKPAPGGTPAPSSPSGNSSNPKETPAKAKSSFLPSFSLFNKAFAASIGSGINLANGQWYGWARACAVFQSGCQGALNSSDITGGWDGWISFIGSGYGVQSDLQTGATSGWAWGGDVLGWITFDDVKLILGQNLPICTDGIDNDVDGLIDSADPDECPIPPAAWCGDGIDNNGNGLIDNLDPTECPVGVNPANPNGPSGTNGPTATLTADDNSIVCPKTGGTVTLTWSTSNIVSGSCVADDGGIGSGFFGPIPDSGSKTISGLLDANSPFVFRIKCMGQNQTSTGWITQTVVCAPNAPTPCPPGQVCGKGGLNPIIKER